MCRSHTRCASFTPPSRVSRRWDASRDGRDDLSARARLRKNSAAAAALSSFLPPSSFLLASAWLARTRSLLIFTHPIPPLRSACRFPLFSALVQPPYGGLGAFEPADFAAAPQNNSPTRVSVACADLTHAVRPSPHPAARVGAGILLKSVSWTFGRQAAEEPTSSLAAARRVHVFSR